MASEGVPLRVSPMRAAIARRMTQSKQQAPHFYLTTEIELDGLLAEAERRNIERAREDRLTVTAFLVTAAARTLVAHPTFNATWDEHGLHLSDAVNIGIAIALDDGLIAPALLDCEGLNVEEVGAALRDLTTRSRAGRLRAREMSDATFTISNLGMFRVSTFTAIIAPPQVAILAIGRSEPRALVRDGSIVIRQTTHATLSSDHRAVDGAQAARFLETFAALLEAPGDWLERPGSVIDAR